MPELRLDLTIMRANARRIADEVAAMNKLWRPHVKAHCQPAIATELISIGACGVTVATVAEAEIMAAAGVPSVLMAHLAVTPEQLVRLAKVAQKTHLLVCADHFVHAELLSQAGQQHDVDFNLLIDVNVGMNRTGCRPRVDATQLAKAASGLPRIRLAGLMGYEGHLLKISDQKQKAAAIAESMKILQHTRDSLLQQGLPCEIVSAGGSGSFWLTGTHPAVTELQCGGGIFGDLFYRQACGLQHVQPALTVHAHVVSRPALDRAIVNCGRKAMNPDIHMPEVISIEGAAIEFLSAEHTSLSLTGPARDLKIGDAVTFAVGYSDLTVLLHRRIHVFEAGRHVDTWSVVRND